MSGVRGFGVWVLTRQGLLLISKAWAKGNGLGPMTPWLMWGYSHVETMCEYGHMYI